MEARIAGNLLRICLEDEAGRNLELIWFLRGLRTDFKTIDDFRNDNRACFAALRISLLYARAIMARLFIA